MLEWCKLLGDRKGKHYWGNVVLDSVRFEADLLRYVGMDGTAFEDYTIKMRAYRDSFVAHLDALPIMNIPLLDTAKAAIWFYHRYVVTSEVRAGELNGIHADTPEKLTLGYEQDLEEAKGIYAGRICIDPYQRARLSGSTSTCL